ncbi:MAG: hypothetical protein WAO98_03580 [Alphaproteobacteria bacterium]
MTIEIETLGSKQSHIAFAFSSKERMELSAITIEPLLAEKNFDLYWVDGSTSPEGQAFPKKYAQHLCEIHTGVRGGADAAILYSLSLLLDKGYAYIGLLENDVKLIAGWWPRLWGLFEQGKADGLTVGAVSSRCLNDRIHVPRDGYAVMMNLGAGMVLFTRAAVEAVLNHYRTGSYGELSFLFNHYTGKICSIPWQVMLPDDKQLPKWHPAADWFFESSLLPYGMAALAVTPNMAQNVDIDLSQSQCSEATKADPEFNWKGYCDNFHKQSALAAQDPVRAIICNYDFVFQHWRAFPHQIAHALPNAFRGGWKCVWSKFNGPFGFVTKEAGASLQLHQHGLGIAILLDNKNKPLTLSVRTSFGDGKINIAPKEGFQWADIKVDHSGPYDIEVIFEQPDVLVAAIRFEGPQTWFRNAYPLRHKDLKPFLE